jgi:hypothetical protein
MVPVAVPDDAAGEVAIGTDRMDGTRSKDITL